jgi:copper homeostasis protein
MLFEVCTDSLQGVIAAQQAGAHRIELCAALVEGGLTPSIGLVRTACRAVQIPIRVLIRPRGGDFLYSPEEYTIMQQDILAVKDAGADGIVTGLLLSDGQIDAERTRALVDLAAPLPVTFHRAFDLSSAPDQSLEAVIAAGADRLLTSGQAPTALAGADCIARLVHQAQGRITILAGGGINPTTLPELISKTGVTEVHFTARRTVPSPMSRRVEGIFMGKAYTPDEYTRTETDPDLIRAVIQSAQAG